MGNRVITNFDRFLNENALPTEIASLSFVEDFFDECPINWEEYGDYGDCFEVSKDLVKWLKPGYPDVKMLVGAKPFEKIYGVNFHAVVEIRGHVIDLTHGQFDPKKKYVVQTLEEFKKEWPITIKPRDVNAAADSWAGNKAEWPYIEDGKVMRKGKLY